MCTFLLSMGNYTKLPYLKCLATALWVLCFWGTQPVTAADQRVHVKGGYFLFSDDIQLVYGSRDISIKAKQHTITGDVLYLDVQKASGVVYGHIDVLPGAKDKNKQWDAVFFKLFPLKILKVAYREQLITEGDETLIPSFLQFAKQAPEMIKDTGLYFEFKEFRIDKNRNMKAKIVIPYMMGLPTLPLRRFTVNRGKWADKTMLKFDNVNYSGIDGLSVAFFLRLHEKLLQGDYHIKLYERKLFGLEGHKRGMLFTGKLNLFPNKKQDQLFGISTLFNSGKQTFNVKFNHQIETEAFRYQLNQTISGRENQPTVTEFRSSVALKLLKVIVPQVDFTHNLRHSYTYKLSTPFKIWDKLNLRIGWQRKIIKDNYRSDSSDLNTSMGFNASFFTLTSNFNYSRNLLEAQVRKNFSLNLKLNPLNFLEENVVLDLTTFYMFSQLPYGQETVTSISPGLNIALRSHGAALPFGFALVPGFTLNHLWDNREESFTDFNYTLALRKGIGNFSAGIEYALASRYRADNFWVEGSNRQNLNINFLLEDQYRKRYSFLLRFYHNNDFVMENISFTGSWNLPMNIRFSAFLLYYNQEEKFQTLEVFVEKTFRKKIKIQGGYSLALKRFFVKFLTL